MTTTEMEMEMEIKMKVGSVNALILFLSSVMHYFHDFRAFGFPDKK
jgi:hypothetical protein